MNVRLLVSVALLLFGVSLPLVSAAELPAVAMPESVGLSTDRLDRIGDKLQSDIDAGLLPGTLTLIYRHGKIAYFETLGAQDPDTGVPMARDSIFRIYSMTKPIVSVGIMMLSEEGKLQIADPVSKWIPELGSLEVAVESIDPGTGERSAKLVPAKRDMTVQDLLRHTSGFTYGIFGNTWVKEQYRDAGIHKKQESIGSMTRRLGTLALSNQPGEVWEYSRSTDVLGYLIEVISGQPLDDFLQERIFDPLGMTDTGFFIPADQLHRAAQPQVDPETGKKPTYFDVAIDPIYLSGGGGLVSTAHDYLRFTRMLLQGGELEGTRLLGRQTVDYMTANQLSADVDRTARAYLPTNGYGFGLGFAVRTERGIGGWPSSPGEYYWAGYAGTYFWVDPEEDMIVLYMTQQTALRRHYRKVLRQLVSQSIID